jgi:hypothetical protein
VANGYTATITNVGDGWFRCTLANNNAQTLAFYQLGLADANNGITPTSSGSAFIWGAQLNEGSSAQTYFPTTDRLNVPRLSYMYGSCPALLLEPQRTNLNLYSEDLGNAYWSKFQSSVTTNVTTSPDGTTNADKLIEDTSTNFHSVFINTAFTVTIGQTYTRTIYAKADGRNWISLLIIDATQFRAFFNLSTGVVGTVTSGLTATIQSVGNGWYRCSVTRTAASVALTSMAIELASADNTGSYTGNGTSGVFLWGAQLELGAYPTTYIPTTTASATRVADSASKTGISSLIGQSSGSLFIEFISPFLESYTQRIFTLSDGTNSNVIGIQLTSTNQLIFYVENGGVNQVVITKNNPAITLGSSVKIAAAYANNDFVFYVNGTQIGTDTSGSVPATSQVRFSEGNGTSIYYGQIKQVALFTSRLTNAELATLTT